MRILMIAVVVLTASCNITEKRYHSHMFEIWTEDGWPPVEMEAPADFDITPYEAYVLAAKSKTLPAKQQWVCYADDSYYYISSAFRKPRTAATVLKFGIRICGYSGEIKRE